MHNVSKDNVLKVSGGNDDGFYQEVGRPAIEAAILARALGAEASLIGYPGAAIMVAGIERFINIAPELGPALADINRLNNAQAFDRLQNPYMYAD